MCGGCIKLGFIPFDKARTLISGQDKLESCKWQMVHQTEYPTDDPEGKHSYRLQTIFDLFVYAKNRYLRPGKLITLWHIPVTAQTLFIMMLSNWNISCVTGALWGESNGYRWIPLTEGQWRAPLMFLCYWSEETVEQTFVWAVVQDIMTVIWRRRNVHKSYVMSLFVKLRVQTRLLKTCFCVE